MNDFVPVSKRTLKRLPLYLSYLKQILKEGTEFVSAVNLGAVFKLPPTSVKKDLSITGLQGVPKVGHKVTDLIEGIEHCLGWDNMSDAFLVGMGNLGRLLLTYSGVKKSGIQITALFDSDKKVIGTKFRDMEILDVAKLPNLAKRMKVHIGIITVPETSAQKVADQMVAAGILAIWNFAPRVLEVPDDIIIENSDMYSSLAPLSHKLKHRLKGE
jgi:redox-sensing transcriptional repressor